MPDKNINPNKLGFVSEIAVKAKLVIRLMKDRRINPLLKLLPFAGVLYLVFPDFLIGPIDDAAILFAGSYLFLEVCPQNIVQEHKQALLAERELDIKKANEKDDIIDGEFHDLDE